MPRMLVAERGLTDSRRNRRWLALCKLLEEDQGMAQEVTEALAWRILQTMEKTR